MIAFELVKAFAGISAVENAIDYLLGAYSLFPHLQAIPEGYWLAPTDCLLTTVLKIKTIFMLRCAQLARDDFAENIQAWAQYL